MSVSWLLSCLGPSFRPLMKPTAERNFINLCQSMETETPEIAYVIFTSRGSTRRYIEVRRWSHIYEQINWSIGSHFANRWVQRMHTMQSELISYPVFQDPFTLVTCISNGMMLLSACRKHLCRNNRRFWCCKPSSSIRHHHTMGWKVEIIRISIDKLCALIIGKVCVYTFYSSVDWRYFDVISDNSNVNTLCEYLTFINRFRK